MLFTFSEIEGVLSALAKEKLTQKQKRILVYLIQKNEDDTLNVTALVSRLSLKLNCSRTTVWNNLNPMKRIGLVDYGSLKTRGVPVRLTGTGMLVSEVLASQTGREWGGTLKWKKMRQKGY